MMMNSDGRLVSSCERLAGFLQAHKNALTSEWLTLASHDSDVPSESMSRLEIMDHVPAIFDAMIDALRARRSDEAMEQVQDVTARHTIIRWAQRYDLRAVLREVSLLREGFIRHLLVFDEQNPGLGSEERRFNSTTIHRILDDIVMNATDTFLNLSARTDG